MAVHSFDFRTPVVAYLTSIHAQAGDSQSLQRTEVFAKQTFTPWVRIDNFHIGDTYSMSGWWNTVNVVHVGAPGPAQPVVEKSEKEKKEEKTKQRDTVMMVAGIATLFGAIYKAGHALGEWSRYSQECTNTMNLYQTLFLENDHSGLSDDAQKLLKRVNDLAMVAYRVQHSQFTHYRISAISWGVIAISAATLAVGGYLSSHVVITAALVTLVATAAFKLGHFAYARTIDHTKDYKHIFEESRKLLDELAFWNSSMTFRETAQQMPLPHLFVNPPEAGAGVGTPTAPAHNG